jgi:hypothetical protein
MLLRGLTPVSFKSESWLNILPAHKTSHLVTMLPIACLTLVCGYMWTTCRKLYHPAVIIQACAEESCPWISFLFIFFGVCMCIYLFPLWRKVDFLKEK